jgi:hypothetical protein
MTDQREKMDSIWTGSKETKPHAHGAESRPRSNAEAVAAGREFIVSMQKDGCWSDFDSPSDIWVTAYVLTRLGQMPSACMTFTIRQQIEESLEWLLSRRNLDGAWGYDSKSPSDAETTAWAVMAMKRHGRSVPAESLNFLRSRRNSDGGFGAFGKGTSAPDVTAVVINALDVHDAAALDFLSSSWLRTSVPASPSRLASRFYICSEVLDWQAEQVPRSALSKVCELIPDCDDQNAFEQALLLRCLTHLRMQKALSVAGQLRRMQLADGSWPASAALAGDLANGSQAMDRKKIFTTVTAISALATAEIQPGLYFGSDRPVPQRLNLKRF